MIGIVKITILSGATWLRLRYIITATVVLGTLVLACGLTDPSVTPTPQATSTPAPQMTAPEAIELTKIFWEENLDFQIKVIQRGARNHTGWRQYHLCRSRYPGGVATPYCGDFENFEEARVDMEMRAQELNEQGNWLAIWESDTQSWRITAIRKSFFWDFRLLEKTQAIEIIPQPKETG